MHQQQEKLKKAAWALFVFAATAAGIYLGVQLFTVMHRTYKTETAIAYTMADSISVQGVAVFQTVEVAGSGSLGYLVQDGERVSEGTTLAEIYTDDTQGIVRERLDRIDRAISLLTKSQNSSGSDLSVLTTQTRTALYALLEEIAADSYGGISEAAEDFLLAQNKLQVSTGQSTGFDATLAELQTQRDDLAAQLAGLQTVVASTNGYFISIESANPVTRDTAALDALSPAELQAFVSGAELDGTDGLAGHIITGFSWRFYAVCTLEQADRLETVDRVGISVPGKENEVLSATVESVTRDEDAGLACAVFECRSINADVLRLGYEEAQIDLHTYTGIRIDRNAMHIVDGEKGVYVKYGDLQRFRRIKILYEDENYILVPDGGKVGSDNEVRLYDEIIVEGSNLQDGKLL